MAKWYIKKDNVNINEYDDNFFKDIDNVYDSNNHKEIVLCIGKVQSGKTNKIIEIINQAITKYDYDIVVFFAGTTEFLYKQSLNRLNDKKINNQNLKYIERNNVKYLKYRSNEKYIISVLKWKDNLQEVLDFIHSIEDLSNLKIMIIDDESDYASVNIAKKDEFSKTYSVIEKIYSYLYQGKLVQVTATPFANIISNKSKSLKCDRVICWSNSNQYTGIHEFNNRSNQVYEIVEAFKNESHNVKQSVIKATRYFMCVLISCYHYLQLDQDILINEKDYVSMLVNVDLDTNRHNEVIDIIKKEISNIKNNRSSFYSSYSWQITDKEFSNILDKVINNLCIIPLNNKLEENYEQKLKKIRIYVGGTMISRGNTFENMLCELILNAPVNNKISVDTLLQRCRWFGYRNQIIDIMKIFMNIDIYNALIESQRYVDILTVGKHKIDDLYRSIQILDSESKFTKSTGKD